MEWVDVKDRLPKEQDLYLCCGQTIDWKMKERPDTIFTAYFYLSDDIYDYPRWMERTMSYEYVTITHWMPLPELPK